MKSFVSLKTGDWVVIGELQPNRTLFYPGIAGCLIAVAKERGHDKALSLGDRPCLVQQRAGKNTSHARRHLVAIGRILREMELAPFEIVVKVHGERKAPLVLRAKIVAVQAEEVLPIGQIGHDDVDVELEWGPGS